MAGNAGDTTTTVGDPDGPSIAERFSPHRRVALMTGGSKRLGLSIARGFARAGATTVPARPANG